MLHAAQDAFELLESGRSPTPSGFHIPRRSSLQPQGETRRVEEVVAPSWAAEAAEELPHSGVEEAVRSIAQERLQESPGPAFEPVPELHSTADTWRHSCRTWLASGNRSVESTRGA